MTSAKGGSSNRKGSAVGNQLGADAQVEQHLLIDDQDIGALPKSMQLKVGAFLTNLMCKNLKFRVGQRDFLLLKP